MRNMRWMGALALVAVALLVLGSMACNKSEDTGTTEATPTDQMPTEGTTSDTATTGTMTETPMAATDDATLQTNVTNALAAQARHRSAHKLYSVDRYLRLCCDSGRN